MEQEKGMEIVKQLVKLLDDASEKNSEVVAVNIVYTTLEHDGTDTHDNCKPRNHHMGSTKIPNVGLKEAIAKATVESGIKLLNASRQETPEAIEGGNVGH